MSSYGYRLERSITAIECADDGRSALRVIPEDSIVLVCSGSSREGMVRILFQTTECEVFEQDLDLIRVGAPAQVELTAYPGRPLSGHVSFVWPTVDEQSRTGRVRVSLTNTGGLIRPGMYATLQFDAALPSTTVWLPCARFSNRREAFSPILRGAPPSTATVYPSGSCSTPSVSVLTSSAPTSGAVISPPPSPPPQAAAQSD